MKRHTINWSLTSSSWRIWLKKARSFKECLWAARRMYSARCDWLWLKGLFLHRPGTFRRVPPCKGTYIISFVDKLILKCPNEIFVWFNLGQEELLQIDRECFRACSHIWGDLTMYSNGFETHFWRWDNSAGVRGKETAFHLRNNEKQWTAQRNDVSFRQLHLKVGTGSASHIIHMCDCDALLDWSYWSFTSQMKCAVCRQQAGSSAKKKARPDRCWKHMPFSPWLWGNDYR